MTDYTRDKLQRIRDALRSDGGWFSENTESLLLRAFEIAIECNQQHSRAEACEPYPTKCPACGGPYRCTRCEAQDEPRPLKAGDWVWIKDATGRPRGSPHKLTQSCTSEWSNKTTWNLADRNEGDFYCASLLQRLTDDELRAEMRRPGAVVKYTFGSFTAQGVVERISDSEQCVEIMYDHTWRGLYYCELVTPASREMKEKADA